jgi:hypothetical protein
MTTAVLATYYPPRIGFTRTCNRHRLRVSPGDRMLLLADGVLETTSPDDTLDTHGIETLLNRDTRSCEDLARHLLAALHGHAASDEVAHDDVMFLLAELVEVPSRACLVARLKHRLLRLERR